MPALVSCARSVGEHPIQFDINGRAPFHQSDGYHGSASNLAATS